MFEMKEVNETRASFVHFILQLDAPNGIEKCCGTLAKIKGMGICFGDSESDCVTNLRFVDDVLLFATSLEQLQKKMCEFKQSIESVG